MDFVVYSSETTPFLLVPACFLPSAGALHEHGALHMLGTVTVTGTMRNSTWRRIVADIDEHTYAILGDAEAAELLGPAYLERQRQRSEHPAAEYPAIHS